MTKLTLPSGSSPRGAQMGRRDELPADTQAPIRLRLTPLRWVDGDYDQFGAYWGGGGPDRIWCAWSEDAETQVRVFVRASDREQAKVEVRETLPAVTFWS